MTSQFAFAQAGGAAGGLRFEELRGVGDPLLLPWLDLFETAFPPPEKVLVSNHLKALRGEADEPGEHHLLAALVDGTFAGLARYQVLPAHGPAYLWYLATQPERRNQGIGAEMYREILAHIAGRPAGEPGVRAMLIEVEMPERASTEAERRLAERRITFYRRLGALQLEGIDYLQWVGPHQAPIPMHLLFHPLAPLDADSAFELGKELFGELLQQQSGLSLA